MVRAGNKAHFIWSTSCEFWGNRLELDRAALWDTAEPGNLHLTVQHPDLWPWLHQQGPGSEKSNCGSEPQCMWNRLTGITVHFQVPHASARATRARLRLGWSSFSSCWLWFMPFVVENIFDLASLHLALPYVHLPLGCEVRWEVDQRAFTNCTVSLHSAGNLPSLANPSSQGRAPWGSFRRWKLMVRGGLLWVLLSVVLTSVTFGHRIDLLTTSKQFSNLIRFC